MVERYDTTHKDMREKDDDTMWECVRRCSLACYRFVYHSTGEETSKFVADVALCVDKMSAMT